MRTEKIAFYDYDDLSEDTREILIDMSEHSRMGDAASLPYGILINIDKIFGSDSDTGMPDLNAVLKSARNEGCDWLLLED